MVRRVISALGERAAAEDPEQLRALVDLQADLQVAIYRAVAGQRAAGITWEAIGSATGTTRQAALMKWGPHL